MNFQDFKASEVVDFINQELARGRTMTSIEKEEFNVGERVITKRLKRKGYTKINNQFIKENLIDEDVIQKNDNDTNELTKRDTKEINGYLHKDDLDNNKLKELIDMIEPLKEVIAEHNKAKILKEFISDYSQLKIFKTALGEFSGQESKQEDKIELKIKNPINVKQKVFKIDSQINEKWEKFVKEHKQFKVQGLVSLALEEFMEKYQ